VDALLDEPSMSELSPSQICAESKDYTDTRTEHRQTLSGLVHGWVGHITLNYLITIKN
jgi:hypothetical protein